VVGCQAPGRRVDSGLIRRQRALDSRNRAVLGSPCLRKLCSKLTVGDGDAKNREVVQAADGGGGTRRRRGRQRVDPENYPTRLSARWVVSEQSTSRVVWLP